MPTQHVATLLGATCCVRLAPVLRCVGRCWLKFDHGQTTPNMSQHIATQWPNARNMLRPTLLRYVALACCVRLAGALETIPVLIVFITKFSIMIGSPRAYFSRKRRAIMWVSNYRCQI